MTSLAPITVAVHTIGRDSRQDLIDDVRRGLTQSPKVLPPRWFYDERGSDLFEKITELPEYYQTRTEYAILQRHADEIVSRTRAASIVELGAGSCTKSRVLIKAAKGKGTLSTFVPFDISESTIRRAASELVEEYTDLSIYCVTGVFDEHLTQIPRFGTQLVVFLGSTIGNFSAEETRAFLAEVRRLMQPGDFFLLGVDLVKAEASLQAAYDDAAGITAEFNLNLLARINRELSADFDLRAFEHVARWNAGMSRVEMYLRSLTEQRVEIPGAGLTVEFRAGELMRTEICTKYTRAGTEELLAGGGMEPVAWYSDPQERFGLALAR
ncbi:MAG TPA: L-histidine N(alpha)-methyltransferase [Candidatus Solibacter sp.]|jgi:L-histidine N-alpha-methyltransferase|nr:L-histidine N(alpha)-methyltransferase [Candidatus Solibacter sp.]